MSSPKDRERLLQMAERWLALAREAEGRCRLAQRSPIKPNLRASHGSAGPCCSLLARVALQNPQLWRFRPNAHVASWRIRQFQQTAILIDEVASEFNVER
jgi:hypothetical protein